MSFTLILNNSNVLGTTNTNFKYNFLGGNFVAKDMEMCISSLAIPYSFFNVSAFYGNNKFSISFPTVLTTTTLSITLEDGFYSVTDINQYIQNKCIANGLYLIDSAGDYVYYFDIAYNTVYYAVQIVCSPVPTTLPSGYSFATSGTYSSAGGLPSTLNQVPQLILPATGGINTIIGFAAGTFPTSATSSTAVSTLSTLVPVGTTVNSLVYRCSIIQNNITTPSDILDSSPVVGTFGGAINYEPSFSKWIRINDGVYNNFVFTYVDQNLNSISAKDSGVTITLMIRKRSMIE